MPSSERSVCEQVIFELTILGLIVSFTFEFLSSKSNEFTRVVDTVMDRTTIMVTFCDQ